MPKLDTSIKSNLISHIQGDLRKLQSVVNIYKKQQIILKIQTLLKISFNLKHIMKIVKK